MTLATAETKSAQAQLLFIERTDERPSPGRSPHQFELSDHRDHLMVIRASAVRTPRFSFVVPFRHNLPHLTQCLEALAPCRTDSELIIVTDGEVDDCQALAARHRARIVALPEACGPAVARNAGAAEAVGDVLVFVDADVVVTRASFSRLAKIFRRQPDVAAAFGAYDEHPAEPDFVSQYKNLSHSLIHRTSASRARTFWAGFGAVRRNAFHSVGGFDERFDRPSVEDIDLGYRLNAAGYTIRLDSMLSASHLKRWTLRSSIVSDIVDRGIPWTQLIWRYGALADDLNLRREYRWAVLLAYLTVACAVAAARDPRLLAMVPLLLCGSMVLNRRHCDFFYRKRGAGFAAGAWMMRFVHDLCNGFSFAAGTLLFVAAQYFDVQLPGGLPAASWNATQPRVASRAFESTVEPTSV